MLIPKNLIKQYQGVIMQYWNPRNPEVIILPFTLYGLNLETLREI
jgi:hypothetical protein